MAHPVVEAPSARLAVAITATLTAGVIAVGVVPFIHHRTLGGSGDQLRYFEQAGALLPFTDHYYGPIYFVALRVVRDVLGADWFTATKLVSLLSALPFLYAAFVLFRRRFSVPLSCAGIALLATNPNFINETYHDYNTLFAAMLVCLAIVTWPEASDKPVHRPLLCGLLFGLAMLTRFQAFGFLVGLSVGVLVTLHPPVRMPLRNLALAASIPLACMRLWGMFLRYRQGFVPVNHNLVHLTKALGDFQDFNDVPAAIAKYGSMRGVLSTPGAIPRIFWYGVLRFVAFPRAVGLDLLGPLLPFSLAGAALWLRRVRHMPAWYISILVALFLTCLAGSKWLLYYTAFLPFFVALVLDGLQALERRVTGADAATLAYVICVAALPWSVSWVRQTYRDREWPEWAEARAYLERHAAPCDLVTSTAGSLPYGTTMRFVNREDIMRPSDADSPAVLRARNVTLVVLTQRHRYNEYPALARLLLAQPGELPAGVSRDTLIDGPHPLAILRIAPAPRSCPVEANAPSN